MKPHQRIAASIFIALTLVGIGVAVLRWRSKPVPLVAKELTVETNSSPDVAINSSPEVSVQTTNAPAARHAQAQYGAKGRFGPLQLMKDSLDLTEDQTKKLEPILKEQQASFAALRRETTLSRRDRLAKVKDMQQTSDAKIMSVLTPEQAEKWRKMRHAPLSSQ